MKKAKTYIWLKAAGLFSTIIVMLLGVNACKGKRHQTKYGPPSDYGYDEPITKYGAPVDYDEDEFDEIQGNDSTAVIDDFDYEESQTKYGVPPDYDDYIDKEAIDTTAPPPEVIDYENTQTKYGVPIDYDVDPFDNSSLKNEGEN